MNMWDAIKITYPENVFVYYYVMNNVPVLMFFFTIFIKHTQRGLSFLTLIFY